MREENREPCENHGRLPPLCSARSGRGSDPGHWGDPRRRKEGSERGHKSGDLPESEKTCAADNGAFVQVCGKTAAHPFSGARILSVRAKIRRRGAAVCLRRLVRHNGDARTRGGRSEMKKTAVLAVLLLLAFAALACGGQNDGLILTTGD